MWRRREIENYLCCESVLLAYAAYDLPDNLFGQLEREKRIKTMQVTIKEVSQALKTLGKPDPWSAEIKASDDFLDPLFKSFFNKLKVPLKFRKSDYHVLAGLMPKEELDSEVTEKLDAIVEAAKRAKPREN